MQEMQWTTIDRKEWPAGPWDGEPDKVQWKDEQTGLPCIAVRHNRSGHWCGYVGVAEGHPAHGVKYDSVDRADPDEYLDVHGGLTYSALCEPLGDEIGKGICHIAAPGEPEHVWWLGFDCAHSGDWSPRDAMYERDRAEERIWKRSMDSSYKGLGYVKNQCSSLAAQLCGPLKITPPRE